MVLLPYVVRCQRRDDLSERLSVRSPTQWTDARLILADQEFWQRLNRVDLVHTFLELVAHDVECVAIRGIESASYLHVEPPLFKLSTLLYACFFDNV